MDLIDKQQRSTPFLTPSLGRLECFLEIRYAGENCRHLLKVHTGLPGQQASDGCLASPWRPPQDDRATPAAAEHAGQHTVGTNQMILSDDF